MNRHVIAMIAGFALDAALGDPHGWPHPVKLIGKQIDFEEGLLRKYVFAEAEKAGDAWPLDRVQTERLGGAALTADVALAAPLVAWGSLKLLDKVHPLCALVGESILCYQLVAARSLRDESLKVARDLESGDMDKARRDLSMIVGRETKNLDEAGIIRAAVETVAENTADGVVAPLLWTGLFGTAGGCFCKAVSTMDSMIAYKNKKYLWFGACAARLDDAVCFIPARLAGLLMVLTAPHCGLDGRNAWKIFRRDRLKHASPNAAHTEAACAGALDIQLNGPAVYEGRVENKPFVGDPFRPVERADIRRAHRLLFASSAASALLALALRALICSLTA